VRYPDSSPLAGTDGRQSRTEGPGVPTYSLVGPALRDATVNAVIDASPYPRLSSE